MKSSYQRLLTDVRNTLLLSPEQGISPDEVKQAIIHVLSPYFLNQSVLAEAAIPILAPEAVNISRINQDAWAREMFIHVLEDYHKALVTDKAACLASCVSWHGQILHGSSEYVSILNLNQSLVDLSLNDFRYEVFRTIGALIEANLQPYLKELLLQIRIRRRKPAPAQSLRNMKLGVVVNELYQLSGYKDLFAPPPWNIPLNQWRNMAQHHKTRVEKGQIIGTYLSGRSEQEIILSREELLNSLKKIQLILSILKGARSIFFVDHVKELEQYFPVTVDNVRDDIKIFHLASSLATQGFDVKDISLNENSSIVILQDVTEHPTNESMVDYVRLRIIHSSQFVYVLWSYFPSNEITIKHMDKDGNLRCTIVGHGSDCEAVGREDIPFEELANRVTITLEDSFGGNVKKFQ